MIFFRSQSITSRLKLIAGDGTDPGRGGYLKWRHPQSSSIYLTVNEMVGLRLVYGWLIGIFDYKPVSYWGDHYGNAQILIYFPVRRNINRSPGDMDLVIWGPLTRGVYCNIWRMGLTGINRGSNGGENPCRL